VDVYDPLSDQADEAQKDQLGFPTKLKLIKTVDLGCVLAFEALWERLGIGKELRDICKAKKFKVP